jgi:oligopeptide/dipeptide ABC transporter ATP-binding protein
VKTGGLLDPTPWARAWERIDADFDGHLEEIQRFLRRPTVSVSDDDMLAGAEDVAALIEGAGDSAEIVSTPGHPAVLGRIDGDAPTLLRYGMYDVQPADEPGWSSPPIAVAPAEKVLTDPLHPYIRSLLTVTPEVGRRRTQQVLTGEPPDPTNIPPGCRFHPRCPVLQSGEAGPHEPRCRQDIPPLGELAPNHLAACHVAAAGDLPPATKKADK